MNIGEEVGMGGGGRKVARRVRIVINTDNHFDFKDSLFFCFTHIVSLTFMTNVWNGILNYFQHSRVSIHILKVESNI